MAVEDYLAFFINTTEFFISYNDKIVSSNPQDVANITSAVDKLNDWFIGLKVANVFGACLGLLLFLIATWRLVELHGIVANSAKEVLQKKAQKKVTLLIWLYNLSFFLSFAIAVLGNFTSWDETMAIECNLTYKGVAFMYVTSNFILYFLLMYRSNAVLDNELFDDHRVIKILRKVVYFTLICFPAYFILVLFVVNGILIPSNGCYQYAQPWGTILFLVSDTTLSSAFLILFIYPLFVISHNSSVSRQMDAKIIRIMRKNLTLSSLAIASTFLSMIYASFTQELTGGLPNFDNLGAQYHRGGYLIVTGLDMITNCFVAHRLTDYWIPTSLGTALKRAGIYINETVTHTKEDPTVTSAMSFDVIEEL